MHDQAANVLWALVLALSLPLHLSSPVWSKIYQIATSEGTLWQSTLPWLGLCLTHGSLLSSSLLCPRYGPVPREGALEPLALDESFLERHVCSPNGIAFNGAIAQLPLQSCTIPELSNCHS